VDRRVVVSPAQAAALLTAAGQLGQRGEHLKTFFAALYYAALRPSEAVMLRQADLHLPKSGWGRIVLSASASRAGRAWTDDGTARQERGLKHRAGNETRTIPIPPVLAEGPVDGCGAAGLLAWQPAISAIAATSRDGAVSCRYMRINAPSERVRGIADGLRAGRLTGRAGRLTRSYGAPARGRASGRTIRRAPG
jgi:integrase